MSYKEIVSELSKSADTERAVKSQRFFKTGKGQYGHGDVFIGITMPALRKVCKHHRDLAIADLQRLLDSPIHEHRMAAVVIMSDIYKKSSPVMQDDLYLLYIRNTRNDRINNWDLVDVSTPGLVGEYLLDKTLCHYTNLPARITCGLNESQYSAPSHFCSQETLHTPLLLPRYCYTTPTTSFKRRWGGCYVKWVSE